jgi:hypothetical protein
MEDLLEGLLELAIQEATIRARDVVKLRAGDKAAYVTKAREAAEKVSAWHLVEIAPFSRVFRRPKNSGRC